MNQEIVGARRLMETADPDTVNHYLRFGWRLINQHLVEATAHAPARMNYVLAAVRTIEETKEILVLDSAPCANEYLTLGWTLIDKFVTSQPGDARREAIHFVVAWQSEGTPIKPGSRAARAISDLAEHLAGDIELESS